MAQKSLVWIPGVGWVRQTVYSPDDPLLAPILAGQQEITEQIIAEDNARYAAMRNAPGDPLIPPVGPIEEDEELV